MIIDGESAVLLGRRPLTPVVDHVPGTAPNRCLQPDARRATVWKNKACNGYADEKMNRTRRVLRTTTAPIFNSFRRMVPHCARARRA